MKKKFGGVTWFLGLVFCTWWYYLYSTNPEQYAIKQDPLGYEVVKVLLLCAWFLCLVVVFSSMKKKWQQYRGNEDNSWTAEDEYLLLLCQYEFERFSRHMAMIQEALRESEAQKKK